MQPSRHPRAPGSFSPLPGASHSNASAINTSSSAAAAAAFTAPPARQPPRRVDSSGSGGGDHSTQKPLPPLSIPKSRQQQQPGGSPSTPIYAQFTAHANASSSSLHQNFSRPSGARTASAAVQQSPLSKGHARKHSATQGLFDSTLPSTSTSNLSRVGMSHGGQAAASTANLTPSQIAAHAAAMSFQNSHSRHRSQTVPAQADSNDGSRRGSAQKMPSSPPVLSLTEASTPRDASFAHSGLQQMDRLGSSHFAATAAANVVFPRSGHTSPNRGGPSPQPPSQLQMPPPPPPAPPPPPEKQSRSEKAKAKLFSRPSKINTKGESKDKPLPSPGKIGSALSALQRANFSTTSLIDTSSQSLYSLNNSSSATIRPVDTNTEEKGKEKKHHFLSRQKHKLKDEYHLPLSSIASNSRPTDPNAPNSLYSFNVPSSPGPNSSSFAKVKKEKKYAERSDSRLDGESSFPSQGDWPAASSVPSLSQQSTMYDPIDPGKLGLHNHMSLDDAWPYLKAKLLAVFEGEDLRLPVEDFNRVVQMHIQWCIHKRTPTGMLEDLRDLLATGFLVLDRTLRQTPEEQFIPTLVELWLFTYTSILPYMQSIFLPLDLEVSGCGSLMTADQARDFWGGVVTAPTSDQQARVAPASTMLDVRRLVLTAYRDIVILPRYDKLNTIFSRLSLEFLPSSLANMAMSSPPLEGILSTSPSESFSSMARPGTAMSIDPVGSYNSTSTTLLGDGSAGGRSRAISNVSFGSHGSDGLVRPFTPSAPQVLGSVREQNVEDSKQVTDMVGRMLQCMSVLSSLGGRGGPGHAGDEGSRKIVELCKMLKLNWLGRGRTGRNRRGIVGGRVRRDGAREEVRVA